MAQQSSSAAGSKSDMMLLQWMLLEKLLKVVPEIYTIWNFRREALAPVFEAGGAPAQAASDAELALTYACLMENPKSYSAWHHRKWVVLKGLCNLEDELKIVSRALEADSRNFHAWHYRQFLVKLLGRSAEDELEYSEEKIAENFSNYSAWHYRSILLPRIYSSEDGTSQEAAEPAASNDPQAPRLSSNLEEPLPDTDSGTAASVPAGTGPHSNRCPQLPSQAGAATAGGTAGTSGLQQYNGMLRGSASQRSPIPVHVLDQEYDMVHQAFATDSEDQSPWMYYRWLVGNSLAHLEAARGSPEEEVARVVLKSVLEREVGRLEQDHLAAVPDAKWPLLTVARLKEAQARLDLTDRGSAEVLAEVHEAYRRLMALDPLRKGYYQDALDGKAFVVVQALGFA